MWSVLFRMRVALPSCTNVMTLTSVSLSKTGFERDQNIGIG